jgi:hypothetical protein
MGATQEPSTVTEDLTGARVGVLALFWSQGFGFFDIKA